jgi:hypothetical protein
LSWTAYLSPESNLPTYDLAPFVPKGARVISDHALISDARDAVEAYRARQEREALVDAGQKELFSA